MQYRDDVKYNSATGLTEQVFVYMSPAAFKKRYGMTFGEWRKNLHKDDYRKTFSWNECYCADDPYAEDVCGTTEPIIEDCPNALHDACIQAAYEI